MDDKKLQSSIALLATQIYPPSSMPNWINKDVFYKEVEKGIMEYIVGRAQLWTSTNDVYWLKAEPCMKIPAVHDILIPSEVMFLTLKNKKKVSKVGCSAM